MTVRCCIAVLFTGALLSAQNPANARDVSPYLDRADQAVQRGETQTAITELQTAIRLNASEPEAHGRLGLAYRKLGRHTDAAKSLERALELRPDPRLKVVLAFTYMDMGNYRNAVPLLAAAFDTEQNHTVKSVAGQRLLECYLAIGQEEQALPYVQKLREIAPQDPNVLYLSSKVYMNLWNGTFQLMLAKVPDSYQVRLIQAEALEAQERFGEAAHEYREILKRAPQIPDIHFRLGQAILRAQASATAGGDAEAEFRKELEIKPAHVAALTALGEIHFKNGERQEASRRFAEALRFQPGDVSAAVGMAKVLIAEKQWPKALEHLEAAAKLSPNDEAVQYNLMLTYRGLGRATEAKRALDTFERLKEAKKANRSFPARPPQP